MTRSRQRLAALLAIGLTITPVTASHSAPRKALPKQSSGRRHSANKSRGTAARPGHHAKGHTTAVFPANAETTPAYRYAQLAFGDCEAEIEHRDIPAQRDPSDWPQLKQPMRLSGALNGVIFRTDRPPTERGNSPYELIDCRLLLALDDFSKLLRAEGIGEAVYSSAYRPPGANADADAPGKRHAGGLAIDIHRFQRDDGEWIKIETDFHGRIGRKVCGKNASPPHPATSEARLLRRLVCGASEQHLFQSILTPNYDHPHRNHLHLEITVGVRWFILS